ncbi:ABC transporter permease [Patulibacter sp. NPDC049589]|uniref:ABC transporter permease n=1 Tax=Patulibacter sp. NPDC049589 TaxID=3154731 RepID=UPI003446A5F7
MRTPVLPARLARAATTTRGLAGRGVSRVGVPLVTTFLAFLAGGLAILVTGNDPFATYKAIFDGSGLSWLFPWTGGDTREIAASSLQQTLIAAAPLALLGLAVAVAYRAGLFNIGGQGQYLASSSMAIWVGSSFHGMPALPHVVITVLAGVAIGALWAGIAGALHATSGANEVITTIMLNWVAIWIGSYLFGLGGPLQNTEDRSLPVSPEVAQSARLPVFWGDPELQGLHIGFFLAILGLVVYWVLIARSRAGYEIRAVGLNPEAARTAGISPGRVTVKAMLICGAFAGLAGAIDVLGWEYRISTTDITVSQIGFLGIAVALLGRGSAVGIGIAALLFGALTTGASQRNLDPEIFDPALGTNLTLIIQGIIVLVASADIVLGGAVRSLAARSFGRLRTLVARRREASA